MRSGGSPTDAYAANGFVPQLVADFIREEYFVNAVATTFAGMIDYTGGLSTMVDSDGVLKWSPHNDVDDPTSPATQNIVVVVGAKYTVEMAGAGSVTLSGAGSGSVTAGSPVEVTATTTTLTLTVVGTVSTMWSYRSDLGGMVDNPDTGSSYVPVQGFLPRRGNHKWNGTAWVNAGLEIESAAATNLLLNTATLATQSKTVAAVAHTLHFTGTGSVTLTGASTAGPLVGTGTGEENRVSLTFTPSAASLTLTVSGTVSAAQLEVGSVPSSYIPTNGATATRIAQTASIAGAKMPAYTDAVSLAFKGDVTYADTNSSNEAIFYVWQSSLSNFINSSLRTQGSRTGQLEVYQREETSGQDLASGGGRSFSPNTNVPFNIASRHGSTFINGAIGGTAFTADTTPTAIADLSGVAFELVIKGTMNLAQVLVWPEDIGDTGIEEASA